MQEATKKSLHVEKHFTLSYSPSVNNRKDVINITRNTYDSIATSYSDKISSLVSDTWIGDYEKQLLDRFLQLIQVSNLRILDIGCGNGKDTAYLMAKGVTVAGIDYSSKMLQEAKRHVPNGVFHLMDMRNLEFSNNNFDGVWANGCIYHVPKVELVLVLKEVIRVLKPEGIFSFNLKAGIGEGLEDNPKSFTGGPRFYAYYSISEIKERLKEAGLEVIEAENYPKKIFKEKIFHIWARKPRN
jgi:ubiquinone/menaquinone biosynthesis C-methylase UbiE